MRFTLRASRAPAANLTVNVRVTETPQGAFLTGTVPPQITIARGSTTADLILQTADDNVDEANGTIRARVEADTAGTHYSVGSPSSASVTVEDDDRPPGPANLRINGHLDDERVTLRWDPVPRVTGYRVRYAEGTGSWETPTNANLTIEDVTIDEKTVKQATLGGLDKKKLYRIEVQGIVEEQGVVVESGVRSNFILVYPTDRPPREEGTRVATIEIARFQTDGRFDYKICDPAQPPASEMDPSPLPRGVTVLAIQNALREWDRTVKWNDASGDNIIQTSGSSTTDCEDPTDENRSHNWVIFYNDDLTAEICRNRHWTACWTEQPPGWGTLTQPPPGPQSIVLRDSEDWDDIGSGRCSMLHELMVHESGHAFGLSHATSQENFIMRLKYEHDRQICRPTKYDVVAMMANYQSR